MHAGLPITLRSPVSLSILAERVYASAYEALENDDPRSAERFFGLLALLAPGDERAWIGLGVSRERSEDWPMAAARYLIGSALVPESGWCHLGRARALRHLGHSVEGDEEPDEAEALAGDPVLLSAIAAERNAS